MHSKPDNLVQRKKVELPTILISAFRHNKPDHALIPVWGAQGPTAGPALVV
jgi:hypothetical protein